MVGRARSALVPQKEGTTPTGKMPGGYWSEGSGWPGRNRGKEKAEQDRVRSSTKSVPL